MTTDSNLQQLSDVGTDGDTRVSDTEELVDEASSGDEDDANKPSTESARGNAGVIVVVNDSTHFGVGRILPRVTKRSATLQHGIHTMMTKAASTLSPS